MAGIEEFFGRQHLSRLASEEYDEGDYIRGYEDFKSWKNHQR